ncbi:MAG: hypothetical protein JWO56_1763 [Acidobacteria bacterium]|nr:hypothetical protein [Acidobacteriota bacterium]
MIRLRLALFFTAAMLALASPAAAGWTLDFTIDNQSSANYSYRGRAFVEGDSVRYDVVEGRHVLFNPRVSIISRQGGKTLIILDHRMKTYFLRDARPMAGPVSTWRAPGQQDTSSVSVHVTKDEAAKGEIAGRPASRYDFKASYVIAMKVEGEKLKAKVTGNAVIWVLEGKNESMPFGLTFALKSGVPDVDAQLEKRVGAKGFPLRGHLSVTRTIGEGDAITEGIDFDVDKIEEARHPDSLFTAPPGYTWREPTFGYQSP